MGLILLNVFIAILMDAYNEVVQDPRMTYSLVEEIKEGWARKVDKIISAVGCSGDVRMADLEEIVDALENDQSESYTYTEFIELLQRPLRERTDLLVRQLSPVLVDLSYKEVLALNQVALGITTSIAGESVTNTPENVTGIHLNGDGDVGVPGNEIMTPHVGEESGVVTPEPEAGGLQPGLSGQNAEDSLKIELYFNRYDLDGSGTLNTSEECRQLITNLIFKLRLDSTTEKVEEHVASMMSAAGVVWDLDTFTEYFNANRENFR